MELKRPAEALAAYRRSLELYPRRFNSLAGAMRAAQAMRQESVARQYAQELVAVADPASRRAAFALARRLVPR